MMNKRRIVIISIFLALFIIALVVYTLFSTKSSNESNLSNANECPQISECYSELALNNVDEIIAKSDVIVFGKVVEKDKYNNFGEEFVFKVNKHYKGKTKKKQIYIYEMPDYLKVGQDYVLFLLEQNTPYFADVPTYTTLNKKFLIGVNEGQIHHSSPLLERGLSLKQLENIIKKSDKIDQINRPIVDYPSIEKKRLSIAKRYDRADFVAHIKVKEIKRETKYVTELILSVEQNYKDTVGEQYNIDYENTPFILPGSYEVGEEYIVFMFLFEGMFYIVSYDGSIVAKHELDTWNKVTETLNMLSN